MNTEFLVQACQVLLQEKYILLMDFVNSFYVYSRIIVKGFSHFRYSNEKNGNAHVFLHRKYTDKKAKIVNNNLRKCNFTINKVMYILLYQ